MQPPNTNSGINAEQLEAVLVGNGLVENSYAGDVAAIQITPKGRDILFALALLDPGMALGAVMASGEMRPA